MCIAILATKGAKITDETMSTCWASNRDGAGFAYADNGGVVIKKGFMKYKDFYEALAEHREKYKSNFLIHFRIRTAGNVVAANTHPFRIPNGALIHNGSISGTGAQYNGDKSDTAIFVEKFFNDLTYDNVKMHKKEIENAISYNKLAMLYGNDKYLIINEDRGHWEDGVWYSNGGYKSYYSSRGYTK